MIPVLIQDLENLQYLPYDIYNKHGRLIFRSGEIITPGKLLQLRYVDVYRKQDVPEEPAVTKPEPEMDLLKSVAFKPSPPSTKRLNEINPEATIAPEVQIAIKSSIHQVIDTMANGEVPDPVIYTAARDKIVNEVLVSVDKVNHLNQLRVFDEYDYSHGVNVSILSVMLGYKVGISGHLLRTLALASLLHDIGKVKIPKQIIHKPGALTQKEYEIVKLHAPLGYKIIKDELGLPEEIAKPALEHQEKFDGTGYPRGISGEAIGTLSQIVSVCDVYDALVSTKVYSNPKPSQDALKIMLNYGSKWFNPTLLYKFTHMTSFNE